MKKITLNQVRKRVAAVNNTLSEKGYTSEQRINFWTEHIGKVKIKTKPRK